MQFFHSWFLLNGSQPTIPKERLGKGLLLALMLIISPPVMVAEEQIASKLLHHYLENLDSYQANFQQQMFNGSRRLMESSSGEFIMKRPNRFRWQIFTPYEQLIIADGENVWIIDTDLEQVTVSNIDDDLTKSPLLLFSRKNPQLEKYFTIGKYETESIDDIDAEEKVAIEYFTLRPKDTSSSFELILLGFKDKTLSIIELHDSLGQITLVRMTNIRNNPIISLASFIYQEIPGFDVIDSRVKVTDGN